MEAYDKVAEQTSRLVTNNYSTSFGLAARLFPSAIRQDIYNIYGLVRLADEIVDSYKGVDAAEQLGAFEQEVYASLLRKFSANPVIHAFQITAISHNIDTKLIAPFFLSMRLDTTNQEYDTALYKKYIDGSAEVVGLMCLKVFVSSQKSYDHLEAGARALGAAFQKVNFLRDMAADHKELKRFYFPNTSYSDFDEDAKAVIILDIENDFQSALPALKQLPHSVQPAVHAAYEYYLRLLKKLKNTSASEIKVRRVRISNAVKLSVLSRTALAKKISKRSHVKK